MKNLKIFWLFLLISMGLFSCQKDTEPRLNANYVVEIFDLSYDLETALEKNGVPFLSRYYEV